VVQLELYQKDACVASRILRANGIPSSRPIACSEHQVVTVPLVINVSASDFARAFQAAESAAPPPSSSTATRWAKPIVAVAAVALCLPFLYFQWKKDSPSATPPLATESRPAAPAPTKTSESRRPATTPMRPTYAGPRSGIITWEGDIRGTQLVHINGSRATVGSVSGLLPGVPVTVKLDSGNAQIARAPDASNNFKAFVLRVRGNGPTGVTLTWSLTGGSVSRMQQQFLHAPIQ
jgi:hypothetical protein